MFSPICRKFIKVLFALDLVGTFSLSLSQISRVSSQLQGAFVCCCARPRLFGCSLYIARARDTPFKEKVDRYFINGGDKYRARSRDTSVRFINIVIGAQKSVCHTQRSRTFSPPRALALVLARGSHSSAARSPSLPLFALIR